MRRGQITYVVEFSYAGLCYTRLMPRYKRATKIIVFDTLAVICFIGVILFGWIPGPGGIPLFILGLSLLAVNHDWAERWLETAKVKGVSFKQWLFPDNRLVRVLYDIFSVTLVVVGVWAAFTYQERLAQGFGVMLAVIGMFIFLLNWERFDSFSAILKKLKH